MLTFTTFLSLELTKPFLQSFYNVTLNLKKGPIIKVSVGNMLHADIVYVPVYRTSRIFCVHLNLAFRKIKVKIRHVFLTIEFKYNHIFCT